MKLFASFLALATLCLISTGCDSDDYHHHHHDHDGYRGGAYIGHEAPVYGNGGYYPDNTYPYPYPRH